MTAKRFTVPKNYRCIQDNLTKNHYMCEDKTEAINLAYLLNELHEEHQKCKEYNGILYANHTKQDRKLVKQISELKQENEQLEQQLKSIEDDFEFSYTENHTEFNKDKIFVKDTHTKIHLDGRNLFIEVYLPQIDDVYRFKYTITGKTLMREFIKLQSKR